MDNDLTSGSQIGPAVPNASGAPSQSEADKRKRNRLQYSCKHCREKKLKCNRAVPCDQCEKRGIQDSCEYLIKNASSPSSVPKAPAVHRARQILSENSALKLRVQQLERLLQTSNSPQSSSTLERENEPSLLSSGANDDPITDVSARQGGSEVDTGASTALYNTTTAGVLDDDSQRHIYDQNWEAILDDVVALTAELTTNDEEMEEADADEESSAPGVMLLLGGYSEIAVEELLKDLPPRPIADRMLAKFFQVEEPAFLILHIPTLLKQYEQFWAAPTDVSVTWLALLYSMFTYASWYCIRSGEVGAFAELGTAHSLCNTYRAAAARCFVQDNYTIPGKYKVEALLIYFGMEYYRIAEQESTPMSASFLWAGLLRLSLHMGYHRDPRHFKNVTPFEGEMRRRVWAQLIEADIVLSFVFGLPSSIQACFSDTEPPRNLHDEDMDENMTELPPSRPDTERTRVLYTITSCRILSVLAEIQNSMMYQEGTSHAKVLELDAKLTAAENAIPALLRPKPLIQAIMDPTGLVIQRYWLLTLVQRGRCVLHRRWMKAGRTDRRFARSRWACINAAVRLLQNQFEMDAEIAPGGRLAKDQWVVTKNIPDYLLADMILCLELSYLRSIPGDPELGIVIPTERILDMLRMSRKIWETSHKESGDASRAFKIISRMLSISTGNTYNSNPSSGTGEEYSGTGAARSPEYQTPQLPDEFNIDSATFPPMSDMFFSQGELSFSNSAMQNLGTQLWAQNATASQPSFNVHQMDAMPDIEINPDWTLFDAQVQNLQADDTQVPWGSFFDSAY